MTENTTLQTIKRWLWKESESSIPNADGFTRLYEETHLFVFRYVYGLSGGPLQEAEDLTAETYARAWKTRQVFHGDRQAALGWLLHIARNLAIDLSRRRKVRAVDESVPIELLADPSLAPEADVITREQITILWHMLGTLPEDVREMLVLRYILGWQVKQIAAYLGVNENNISVTIRRALKSLQRNWRQSQENDHE
ncbi:MAG TPA: RNA polymerase sigma factor [Anaerolineales bacterium]|nr:RNA polymerase sigma factor [Anaerolineales bacterium]